MRRANGIGAMRHSWGWFTFLLLACCIWARPADAIPAFPGAEGFGAETVGGRGGKVYAVTNLGDSAPINGFCGNNGLLPPGSLRWALYNTDEQPQAGNRIVIFQVAGTITLNSTLCIPSNTTIAGQTAPNEGVAIKLHGVVPGPAIQIGGSPAGNDVVIRHIRVRPGANSAGVLSNGRRAISIANNSQNVIIDHVSASWGVDSVLDSISTRNVTVQWSILSEGLDCSTHDKTAIQCSVRRPSHSGHSTGTLIATPDDAPGMGFSLHHNLYASDRDRLPFIVTPSIVDVVNNVIYNPIVGGTSASDNDGKPRINLVENYYRKALPFPDLLFPYYELWPVPIPETNPPTIGVDRFDIFLMGNRGWHRPDNTYPETNIVDPFFLNDPNRCPDPPGTPCTYDAPSPHPAPGLTTTSADAALDDVLANAGATLPVRDDIDARIAGTPGVPGEVASNNGKFVDNPCDVLPGVDYRGCMDTCTTDNDACRASCGLDDPCLQACNLTHETCMLGCGSDSACLNACGPEWKCLSDFCVGDLGCINGCAADPQSCAVVCQKEHYCVIGCCTDDPWPDLTDEGQGLPADSDSDFLPDAWELAYGLDPITKTNLNIDTEDDGYTLIEEYLNSTDPAVIDGVPSPIDVMAVAGLGSATVSWTPRQPVGGETITGFTVTATPGIATASVTGAETSAVVTGLAAATTYTFTIVASTATASSVASLPSNPITTHDIPSAPLNVGASPAVASADVSWSEPADDGGTPVTSYRVETVRTINLFAGQTICASSPAELGDDGPAIAARLCFPIGMTVDGAGNVYIADFNHNLVRKVDASGIITTVAGGGTLDPEGVPAQNAVLNSPTDVILDDDGNLYITNFYEGQILKVDTSGMISSIMFGLNFPVSLARDAAGDLYVSEYGGGFVKKVFPDPDFQTTIVAGTGSCDLALPVPENVPATTAELCTPIGIAFDTAGNLYIADSEHNMIRRVDGGGNISTAAGTGSIGDGLDPNDLGDGGPAALAKLSNPFDVATDSGGGLYIADQGHNRVRKVAADGTIWTAAGDGQRSVGANGIPAVHTSLFDPAGVAVNATGQLFIAEGANRVRVVGPEGPSVTVPGTQTSATIPGLEAGMSYSFVVLAANAVGQGPYSQPSNTVTIPTEPDPPTVVSATPGVGEATACWTAPVNDGGSPITGYTATASPGGNIASVGGGVSCATVTGLTKGTAYTFTVVATNAVGDSVPSQPSNPATVTGPPDPPVNVSATAAQKSAIVNWDAPANEGGTAVTLYTVTAAPGGVTATTDGSGRTVTVGNLSNGTTYTFTVTATNAVGTSAPSQPSNAVRPPNKTFP